MATDRTEEEQVEVLKEWLNENGTSLIGTIVVVLAVVFGYRTWETQTRETAEAASAIYEDLVAAMTVKPLETPSEENLSTGNFLANQLKTDHADSTYAHFAAMHLAKIAVEKDDLDGAAKELQWVLANDPSEMIKVIVNLRLARVKFGQGESDGATALLDSVKPGAHMSSYEELRGDILYAQDKHDEARAAYQRAVNAQDSANPMTQMKLEDLAAPKTTVAADKPEQDGEEEG